MSAKCVADNDDETEQTPGELHFIDDELEEAVPNCDIDHYICHPLFDGSGPFKLKLGAIHLTRGAEEEANANSCHSEETASVSKSVQTYSQPHSAKTSSSHRARVNQKPPSFCYPVVTSVQVEGLMGDLCFTASFLPPVLDYSAW